MKSSNNSGFWKSLEKLVKDSEIVIDRPRESHHPKFPKFIYPVDYGYLKDTASMDGGGIDIWVGTGKNGIDAIVCSVDEMKKDSEVKILLNCTESEKKKVLKAQNQKYMKAILIRRKD